MLSEGARSENTERAHIRVGEIRKINPFVEVSKYCAHSYEYLGKAEGIFLIVSMIPNISPHANDIFVEILIDGIVVLIYTDDVHTSSTLLQEAE